MSAKHSAAPIVRLRRGGRALHRALALAVAAAATCALVPTVLGGSASAAAFTDHLAANEQLNPGERLVSPNGLYALVMQGDGNLVEYAPGNRAVWATGTARAGSVVRMQSDGNLVVVAPGNVPVWATGTSGNPAAAVTLQSDGNVVVYGSGHVARWASGVPGAASTLGARIAAVARAEEQNPAHKYEAGANCNFYSAAGGTGTPCAKGWRSEAWCADFARWVYGQAGARTAGLTPGAASFASGGATAYRAGSAPANARVGDAVLFNLNSAKSWASHVGIVVAVNGDGTITTVEGNSGDMVALRRFAPATRGVSGYASPVAR